MDALAGEWRGADKETGITLPDHGDGLCFGHRGSQLHDHDDGCRGCDRRQGVHDNAELAVICVGFVGVEVGYLSYRKQRQKDKAQPRNHRQKATATAAIPGEVCLEAYQTKISAASILQMTVPDWTPKFKRGCFGPEFLITAF